MAVCQACGHQNPAGAGFCNACGTPLAEPVETPERRKTVTILFCDVTGSTALGERLDPESLRQILARYFDISRDAVERHGGVVEKFIGDAVMAIFGVPQVHEDDALRALRAATELRGALQELNRELEREYETKLTVRIAVNTGEVVTGTEERLATGDAVNVAARLEQAAEPGQILIGQDTYPLVRDAVEVEQLEPLELKGKAETVPAYRLVSLSASAPAVARRLDAEMVGRERELMLLQDAFGHVVTQGSCHLFTILGTAGVGKSRLVSEFLRTLTDATVVQGRCVSYGEGITYWPVVEVAKQLGGPGLLGDEVARHTLDAVLGEVGTAGTPDEIAWAFRKLLETRASESPVVCMFDDIQWGEDTFLDLVEHVADLSRGVPIFLLCMARPELLDRRAAWGGGKLNATSVLLEPLSEPETGELISRLLEGSVVDDALQVRVQRAAGGNPLFVEEMLALVAQSRNGEEVAVPPTIQALLGARLDQLDPSERNVLERGSVEGEIFHRAAVAALSQDVEGLDSRLTALVRKDLVRPVRPQFSGEDGFRFRHLLIRDAAYEALPKATRADLHERFAAWLEERAPDLVELDEIVGYHLEQVVHYRRELGRLSEHDRRSSNRAGELLGRAGHRALERGDRTGAANLLERAAELLAKPDPRHLVCLLDLGRSLAEGGDDLPRSRAVLDKAVAESESLGREDLEMRARLEVSFLGNWMGFDVRPGEQEELALRAITVLERHGDDEGLGRAWFALATSYWLRAEWDEMREPLEHAIEHARRAGNKSIEIEAQIFVLASAMFGSGSVEAGVRVAQTILDGVPDSRELEGWAIRVVGTMRALEGRFQEARELLTRAQVIFAELDNKAALVALAFSRGPLELAAGDALAAEHVLRTALESAQRMGDRGREPNLAAMLADALFDLGRIDEAAQYAEMARDTAQADDASAQALWRIGMARLLVRRGDAAAAVQLAREAVAIHRQTQEYLHLPRVLLNAAEVLRLASRESDASELLREAVRLSEERGASGEARRAADRLSELAASS